MFRRYWVFNHLLKFQDSVCNGSHEDLIIIALCMTLANLKQLIFQKILCLIIMDLYEMHVKNFNT